MALAITSLSMVLAMVTWLMLDSGHWSIIRDKLEGNRQMKLLWETNQGLVKENKVLEDRVLMLEQTSRLDKDTATLMQRELIALQDENHGLKRELEFYQGVMDAARKVSGIDIPGLYIESLHRVNQYQMKLVLTHVAKSDKVIKGSLDINIEGVENKTKVELNLKDLLIDEKTDLSFELKNFRKVEYRFELPHEFLAERVLVRIQPSGRNESPVLKIYDWPVTDNEGA